MTDEAVTAGLDELWREHGASIASASGAYVTLREAILTRVLEPGTRLAEEELAARFGISRTPVREAILRLEAEGLATRSSGRTARVTDLSPREIVEIYEVRAVLDGLAAEMAAAHIEPPAIATLEWINKQMADAGEAGDYTELAALNLRFHGEIAAASGNLLLNQMIESVHDRVRRFPGTTFAFPERWKSVIAEHEGLIAALRDGNEKRAFDLARDHMIISREVRIAMLDGED